MYYTSDRGIIHMRIPVRGKNTGVHAYTRMHTHTHSEYAFKPTHIHPNVQSIVSYHELIVRAVKPTNMSICEFELTPVHQLNTNLHKGHVKIYHT